MLLLALLAACARDISVEPSDGATTRDARSDPSDAPAEDAAAPDADPMDATAPDLGHLDASAADTGPAQPACRVDRFLPCADADEDARRNDDWASATPFNDNRSVGCIRGDELTTLERTRTSTLCSNESADFYGLQFVHCDTRSVNAQIRLHPRTECDPADFSLGFRRGVSIDCANPPAGVRCRTEGVDRIIEIVAPPDRTVSPWYFSVEKTRSDVRLEYSLTVRIF